MQNGSSPCNLKVKMKMVKVHIYYLNKKNYNKKTLPLKVRIKIKIELTENVVKNRTNLRDKFTKILKRKQDYR